MMQNSSSLLDFKLDQFSELCIKALDRAEKLQMKTNVLGLNIGLNEDFDAIYLHMKKSFGCMDRIIANMKEFIDSFISSLRLTHIECMRSRNALVYELRKKAGIHLYQESMRVIPYQKYEADKQLIEDRLLAFRRMSTEQKKINSQSMYEEVETIFNAMRKDQRETYEGFNQKPNDFYRISGQPSLAPSYWQLMAEYRSGLQRIQDNFYIKNTKIFSGFVDSMVKFNSGMAQTRHELVMNLLSRREFGKELYAKDIDQKETDYAQRGALKNRFRNEKKVVRFNKNVLIQKELYSRQVPQYYFEWHQSQISLNNDIWSQAISNNFFSIDQMILLKNRKTEQQFNLQLQKKRNENINQLNYNSNFTKTELLNQSKKIQQNQLQESKDCQTKYDFTTDKISKQPVSQSQFKQSNTGKHSINHQEKNSELKIEKKANVFQAIQKSSASENPSAPTSIEKSVGKRMSFFDKAKNKSNKAQTQKDENNSHFLLFSSTNTINYKNNTDNPVLGLPSANTTTKDTPKSEIKSEANSFKQSFPPKSNPISIPPARPSMVSELPVWSSARKQQHKSIQTPLQVRMSKIMSDPNYSSAEQKQKKSSSQKQQNKPIQKKKSSQKNSPVQVEQRQQFWQQQPSHALLNPRQLYEHFCEDFSIKETEACVTGPSVCRYGMVVPINLEQHTLPHHRKFIAYLLKEQKYVDDPRTGEEKYDYRGTQVVFEHQYKDLEQVYRVVLTLFEGKIRSVIVFGDTIALVTKMGIGKNKFIYRLRWFKFQGVPTDCDHSSIFKSQFSTKPTSIQIIDITTNELSPNYLQKLRKGIFARHFCEDGGNFNDHETTYLRSYEKICGVFEGLVKSNYVCMSRPGGQHGNVRVEGYEEDRDREDI